MRFLEREVTTEPTLQRCSEGFFWLPLKVKSHRLFHTTVKDFYPVVMVVEAAAAAAGECSSVIDDLVN